MQIECWIPRTAECLAVRLGVSRGPVRPAAGETSTVWLWGPSWVTVRHWQTSTISGTLSAVQIRPDTLTGWDPALLCYKESAQGTQVPARGISCLKSLWQRRFFLSECVDVNLWPLQCSNLLSLISLSLDQGFWRGGKRSQRLKNLNTGKIAQLKPLLKTSIQSPGQAFETEILWSTYQKIIFLIISYHSYKQFM